MKLGERKAYKSKKTKNTNMIPSDPTGSLDDFIFSLEVTWRK